MSPEKKHPNASPPELVATLARRMAGDTASLLAPWQQAVSMLDFLKPPFLEQLVTACPGPATARQLALFLAREEDPNACVTVFLKDVDESGESLPEWLDGFRVLATHLEGTRRQPDFSDACGFLHCCAVVVDSGPRYASFADTVESMLATYGFSGREG